MNKRPPLFIVLLFLAFISSAQKQSKIDSLFKLLKAVKGDTAKVNTLNTVAFEMRSDNPDTAIYFAKEAAELATKLNYKLGVANAYLWIGSAATSLEQYDKAVENLKDALKYYDELLSSVQVEEKPEIVMQKAKAINNIGVIYKNQNNYPEALKNFFISLKMNKEVASKEGMAMAYNNIGLVYWKQGNHAVAVNNFSIALKLSEETGDKKSIAFSYNCIGGVYTEQGNYPEALTNQFASLKIWEEIGDKQSIAGNYGNLGDIYKKLDDYPNSLKNYSAALKIFEETGDGKDIAITYSNIGNIYDDERNYNEALKKHFAALKIMSEIGEKSDIALCNNMIGGIYTEQKNLREASEYLNKGLSLSIQTGDVELIQLAYSKLYILDSVQGNFKQAFAHYKLAIAYHDSIFNEENAKKIVQLQMQYDFDKKQAAQEAEQEKKDLATEAKIKREKALRNSFGTIGGIILLMSVVSLMFYKRKRDAEQKQLDAEQKEKETATILRIKETELKALRLQMNPHFIDNALQSIQHFLNDHKPAEAEEYLVKFSNLMRSVLMNSERSEIPLSKELETLEWYMQLENLRMNYPFTYKFHIDKGIDIENTTVPPNIIQPFVENSIRHGLLPKSVPGNISIYVHKKEDDLHIIVEDDGIGRNINVRVQQPVLLKRESLGIKITQERLNIINRKNNNNASFKIFDLEENNKPTGTRVELNLPFQI